MGDTVEVTVEETEPEVTVEPVIIAPTVGPDLLPLAESVGRMEALVMEIDRRLATVEAQQTITDATAETALDIAVSAEGTAEAATELAALAVVPEPEPEPEPEQVEDESPHKEHPWFRSRSDWRK